MYSTTSKWINVLSILLGLLSMGQLMYTASVLFLISIILSKTGGYFSTICGLIASLVCLPVAFKVRSFYSAYEIRVHHFDMQTYHRYMLYICLGVQTFCVFICCYSLTENRVYHDALSSAITKYQRRFSDKKFVDIVQGLFQCCGIFSFRDWAKKSWLSTTKQEIFCSKEFELNLKNPTVSKFSSNVDYRNIKFLTSLPYSCCKIETAKPCRNFDLKCSGTGTINTDGCLQKLTCFVSSILFSELLIITFIIIVIVILLKMLNIEESEICCEEFEDFSELHKYVDDDKLTGSKWEKFTNSIGSSESLTQEEKLLLECCSCSIVTNSITELEPTVQEELVLNKTACTDPMSCSCTSSSTAELVPSAQEQLVLSSDKTTSKEQISEPKVKSCCKSTKKKSKFETIFSMSSDKKIKLKQKMKKF